MIWYTADTHIGHRNILTFTGRPYQSVEAMNEAIVSSWNSVVGDEDTVFILGDFALCGATMTRAIISRLRGHKILVRGNHDCRKRNWYINAGIENVVVSTAENPYRQWWSAGWVWISHYPFRPRWWDILCLALSDWMSLRHINRLIPEDGNFLVHGHVHQRWATKRRMFNCGWDIHHRPVSRAEIENWMRKRVLEERC